ncbi:hypothetical protein J5J86_15105 [Aquabacter sp. L1I39]|uniref:hypothetical protein n=1 Tax=Aquabacter sp. L1I39 TaxID=2820278 RepID=UPI001ADC61AD|nr:hypothetical protein [Aquabacter sp. L1I39]QTL02126.1 hypothetical protein J5J86_15105 [Aquabacter sp. L1I39]
MTETPNPAPRVRHAVDSGETRDKIRYSDPAAAPLGTDDEAAGLPPRVDGPPEKGDRIADGDTSMGELYEPESEEDNRAPATAPPSWRTWGLIAAGILVFGIAVATLAG